MMNTQHRYDEISADRYGTPTLIYQMKAVGEVGGVLGRFCMLKFHHNYADFSTMLILLLTFNDI